MFITFIDSSKHGYGNQQGNFHIACGMLNKDLRMPHRFVSFPLVLREPVDVIAEANKFCKMSSTDNALVNMDHCIMRRVRTFTNVFASFSLFEVSLLHSTSHGIREPAIGMDPTESFFRHCIPIDIDPHHVVRKVVPEEDIKNKSFAYMWGKKTDAIGVYNPDSNTLTFSGEKGHYDLVIQQPTIHGYAAPVFFKPSHNEIQRQIGNPGAYDDMDFYISTIPWREQEFCADYHIGITSIFMKQWSE